jgi:hypothetical protein
LPQEVEQAHNVGVGHALKRKDRFLVSRDSKRSALTKTQAIGRPNRVRPCPAGRTTDPVANVRRQNPLCRWTLSRRMSSNASSAG